jgi:glyoxylase-like metal-dependent hydrolase (beta-lactamase superfamily II)
MIPAGNPGPYTGDGNRTWLVRGRYPTLIDAGTGESSHLLALEAALASEAAPLATVIITHAHSDHIEGVARLAARWPNARFCKTQWPGRDEKFFPHFASIGDGDLIEAGDSSLQVVATPGHAPDHIALWHREDRTVFSGDLLVQGGTVVIPATRGGDLRAYLRSLERVLALDPLRALPAHGPIIDRPAELIRGYLVHRARRETQVLELLEDGPATPTGIASKIYELVPDALRDAAEESVLAHLKKLVADGRVRNEGDRFALVQVAPPSVRRT